MGHPRGHPTDKKRVYWEQSKKHPAPLRPTLRPTLRQLSRGSASLLRAYASDSVYLLRLRLLARRTQADAKAEVVVAVRRDEPAAERRPTNHGGVAPTAATLHAVRARCSTTRVRHATYRVIFFPILTPLPNIPIHIVQPPGIGELAAYWMSVAARVVIVPSVIT